MKEILIVFAGGGTGSVLRYLFGLASVRFLGPYLGYGYPWATLACNLGASMLLGFLFRINSAGLHPLLWLLLAVGFCGGWSTFSSFSMETIQLFRAGKTLLALTYMSLSMMLCLGGFWLCLGRPEHLYNR